MLIFSKNYQQIVSVATTKLKRVFNSLMVFVVRVFPCSKKSPDIWAAGVAPRADVLALVLRFLCTVAALSVNPGRFFFQQSKAKQIPKGTLNAWNRGLSCESRRSERSQLLCVSGFQVPIQCGIRSENTCILILINLADGSFIRVILDQRNVCKSCKICTLCAFRDWSMFSYVVVRLHQIVRLWKTLIHRCLFVEVFVIRCEPRWSP